MRCILRKVENEIQWRRKSDGASAVEQAAELVLVFKKIWHDAWGARMEDVFCGTLSITERFCL